MHQALDGAHVDAEVADALMRAEQAGAPAQADVLVEYFAADVAAQADARRARRGARVQGDAELAFKRGAYKDLKAAVRAGAAGSIEVVEDYANLPMQHLRLHGTSDLQALRSNPAVMAIFRNGPVFKQAIDATSLAFVSQPAAAASGFTGAGQSIAIIDDGINYALADFNGCSAPATPAGCRVLYANDFTGTGTLFAADNHGTNVASIATQVASGVNVLSLNVFGSSTVSYDATIIAAIDFAIANRTNYGIAAINLSLGGVCPADPTTSAYIAPFSSAQAIGMFVAAAAGNNGTGSIDSPACAATIAPSVANLSNVYAVGAVYSANVGALSYPGICSETSTAAGQLTCFSNYTLNGSQASWVGHFVAAPGFNLNGGGVTYTGTSQATPWISATLAMTAAKVPYYSATSLVACSSNDFYQAISGPSGSFARGSATGTVTLLNIPQSFTAPNDAYALAAVAPASGSATGALSWNLCNDSYGATFEAGEPNPGGYPTSSDGTVWLSAIQNRSGPLTFTFTPAVSNAHTVAVYAPGASVSALGTPLATASSSTGAISTTLTVPAANTRYAIQISGAPTDFTVAANYTPPPNDNFANRTSIAGLNASVSGYNTAASSQTGDPAGLFNTIWFTGTPATSGQASCGTGASQTSQSLVAYTGSVPGALVQVASAAAAGSAPAVFAVSAGTPYQIVLGTSTALDQGGYTLTCSLISNTSTNLSVTLAASSGPGGPAQALYTGTVTNGGPAIALGTQVVVTLAAGETFVPANSSTGCTASGQTITCVIGTVGAGAASSFWVAANVSSNTLSYPATATVSFSGTDTAASTSSTASYSESSALGQSADIPIPPWALGVLGMGVAATLRRRRRTANPAKGYA